jgi:hypothetical protein
VVCLAQLGEEQLMKALEDARLLPVAEASPAGHPRAV